MKRLVVVLLLGSACATATRLDHVVLAYDETTADSQAKLLLLNIARARQDLPMHFTGISNVVATYRFTFSGGVLPAQTGDWGWLPMPQFGGSSEESPTVSIAPMQGDEFTQRLLTPFEEQKLTLLLRQGYDVDALLRLLGAEVHLHDDAAKAAGVFRNRPADGDGYERYRRLVSHLSTIQDRHALFVEPLHFLHSWTVPAETVTPEAFATTYKDFALTLEPDKKQYRVTKKVNGRVLISNYDPSKLSEAERRRLHALAEDAPYNDVLIDVRQEFTGGELPIQGRLRLRSFHEVLTFVGRAMGEEPERDVKPDPRTPPVAENPVTTLEIVEAPSAPDDAAVAITLHGRSYAVVRQPGYPWNLKAFTLLNQLFQMTVATVTNNGPSITIAK